MIKIYGLFLIILYISLSRSLCNIIHLNSSPNLINFTFSSPLTFKSSPVSPNATLVLIDKLTDKSPTTKPKFYTVKSNSTLSGLNSGLKFKRNNTKIKNLDQQDQEKFKYFGCSLVCNLNKDNCTSHEHDESCRIYYQCSTNSSNYLNNTDHDSSSFPYLIEKKYYCDNICDCPFCDDEINCSITKCSRSNEIMCADRSACIEPKKICNTYFDCKDRSDEDECFDARGCKSSGRFSCDNLCLERALVCDNLKEDCLNGKDERNCECNDNEYKAFNGDCISQALRCNGKEESMDGSDEWMCVLIDERDIVLKIMPSNNHGVLCADTNFTIEDADQICHLIGKESALEYSPIEIELENGTTWLNTLDFWSTSLNQTDLKDLTLNPTSQQFTCKDNLAQTVVCKKFNCSEIPRRATNRHHIGTPTEIESMVRLRIEHVDLNNNTKLIECSAQIISPVWLLSSYNCLNQFLSNNFKLDEINLSLNRKQNVSSKIKRIILHPHSTNYRSKFIRNFDLGLVQLDKPISFEERDAGAICLPNKDIDLDITCFLTNFNDTEPIPFLVVPLDKCNEFKHYNNTVLKDNICTVNQKDHDDERADRLDRQLVPSIDTMNASTDNTTNLFRSIRTAQNNLSISSPLICLNSESKWYIAGFLNYFDDRNNLEHPTVFSNVYKSLDFISKVTGL